MKIRRLLRIWHRDLGYFITGMVLIYAVSGIVFNHRKEWNPDCRVVSETILLDLEDWRDYSSEEIGQVLQLFNQVPVYKKHFNSNQKVVKVFVENGMVIYDPLNGAAELEFQAKMLNNRSEAVADRLSLLQFAFGYKFQRNRIHTMPGVFCRKTFASKNMAQVSSAIGAGNFSSPSVSIGRFFNGSFNFIIKTGPPTARIELIG